MHMRRQVTDNLFQNMPKSCRYYEQKFPEVDEVVMVNVRSIAEMGAYVSLLEYDNIEGMVRCRDLHTLLSDLFLLDSLE